MLLTVITIRLSAPSSLIERESLTAPQTNALSTQFKWPRSTWVKEEGNLLCQNSQFYFWWENFFTFLVWVCNSSSVLTPPAQVHMHLCHPVPCALCLSPPEASLLLLSLLLYVLVCMQIGFLDLSKKHMNFLPVSTLTQSLKKKITKRVDYKIIFLFNSSTSKR